MKPAIDITDDQWVLLSGLIRRFLPDVEVWAHGSRVKWTARPTSDLDLVAFCSLGDRKALSHLKDVLAESSLPFVVDLLVWDDVPVRFHSNIKLNHVVIQEAAQQRNTLSHRGRWAVRQVDELARAGVLVIGDGYRAKNSELSTAGIPFARAGNINNGFNFGDADRFPEAELGRVGNKVSQPGDVVFTSKGTVGRFAFVRPETPRFVYSPQLCFWRSANPAILDPWFLYYWMLGREFYVQFKGVSGQTDMAEYVSLSDQRRMYLTLPPTMAEQRAIASILGALDDKIESNRRTRRAVERVARALFRAWFVDFEPVKAKSAGAREFPGMPAATFAALPSRFVPSELGPVPDGWGTLSLYETATYINGAAFKTEHFCAKGQGLPVIKIVELKNGVSGQTQYTLRDIDQEQRIDTGDMLYSWSGSPDTSLDVFLWANGPGVLNQHIFKVVTQSAAQKRYVYYLLRHLRPQLIEIARNKQTTGLGHVTVRDMKHFPVVKPPCVIMDAFDNAVGPLFDKAFACELETSRLATLRDYLLPKLLSGAVRAPDIQEVGHGG